MKRETKTCYFPKFISSKAQEIMVFLVVGGGSQAIYWCLEPVLANKSIKITLIYLGGCVATPL